MSKRNPDFYENGKWWTYGPRDNWSSYLYRMVVYPAKMLPGAWRYGPRYLVNPKYRKSVRNRRRGHGRQTKSQKGWLFKNVGPLCQGPCGREYPIEQLTLDHRLHYTHPEYKWLEHLQLLCRPCHDAKDHQKPQEKESFLWRVISNGKK